MVGRPRAGAGDLLRPAVDAVALHQLTAARTGVAGVVVGQVAAADRLAGNAARVAAAVRDRHLDDQVGAGRALDGLRHEAAVHDLQGLESRPRRVAVEHPVAVRPLLRVGTAAVALLPPARLLVARGLRRARRARRGRGRGRGGAVVLLEHLRGAESQREHHAQRQQAAQAALRPAGRGRRLLRRNRWWWLRVVLPGHCVPPLHSPATGGRTAGRYGRFRVRGPDPVRSCEEP